jgi:hypothetical protein
MPSNCCEMRGVRRLTSAGLYQNQINLTIPAGHGTGARAQVATVGGVQAQSGGVAGFLTAV